MKEILLVEASPALLACRVKTLEREGYQVTGASTAGEVAKAMRQQSYDLLIVDAEVPEVLGMLSSEVPTLIMVNEETVDSVACALPVGIWGFLVKPFTAGEFSRAVAEAIEKADAVKEAMQQKILLPLNNTSQLLVSEAEMDKFFKRILEVTAAETEADRVSVLTLDEESGELAVRAKVGIEPGAIGADEKIGEWVMKTSQPLMVDDRIEANAYVKEIMSQLGASGLLSVPLITGEKVIGAINGVKVVKGSRFTSGNLDFLSILAKQVAIATENASLFTSVQRQRLQLEKLLEKATLTQENERKRVAIEIHDSIGQQIVGALYRMRAFEFLLALPMLDEAQVEANEIKGILEKTLDELRRALAGLHPLTLDELGLTSALHQEVEKLNQETNTKCHFQVEGIPIELTSSQEAAMYRVVQEALTNIRKHANATEASVQLHFEDGTVSVRVSDNGKGFKLDERNTVGHLGLLGMKERAEMLGGNLNLTSKPESGTSIVLTFPTKS
ncbi:hypothetical protein ES703_21235 [subsurface metagenome]